MTREEAIKRFKEMRTTIQPFLYVDEVIDYAIKALEQEPCSDAVSRQAVLDVLCNLGWGCEENGADTEYVSALEDCAEKVKELPSVTPQEQTGQWTERKIHETTGFFLPTCSECGEIQPYAHHTFRWDFCPSCGAYMGG